MLRRHLAPLVALAMAVSGCASDEPPTPGPTPEDEPVGEASTPDHTIPESAGVALSGDGLGIVSVGDEATAALATLQEALGQPNTLSRWLPKSRSLWGRCPGEQVRGAKWGDLWVLFADATELSQERHLFGWTLGQAGVHGRSDARTAEGIGVGSTVAELEAAYGDRLTWEPYELGVRFEIAPTEGEDRGPRRFGGVASGTEPDDQVRTLRGGLVCTA